MNKLTSLLQIKQCKAKPLAASAHQTLAKSLSFFTLNSTHTQLAYNCAFKKESLPFVHEKMSRIGCIADEIDHHPQWTLAEAELQIQLSTHDIGNKVSIKDYILAQWIEQVLHGKELEEQVIEIWNKNQFNVLELQ